MSTENAPIRFAVVGLGYWGPNLVRNLVELPGAEVAWCCDLRASRLAAVGGRYPDLGLTHDYEQILTDPTVDAVLIATPLSSHYALSRAALECGKHTFVEKPLAASSEATGELIDLANERGLILMPGHTFIYSPPVNVIRNLIASGELGEIYFVSSSRVNLGLHQPDASVVWDLAPHDFSILRYWFEERPTHVSAISRACIFDGLPDVAFIHLEFESGMIGQVELSWLAPTKLRRTAIVGSEKMIVYDDTHSEPVRIFDSGVIPTDPQTFGEFQLSYRSGGSVSPPVDAVEPISVELSDFCRSIRTGEEPVSSPALGLEVVRMVEATERSLAHGGALVSVSGEDAEPVGL